MEQRYDKTSGGSVFPRENIGCVKFSKIQCLESMLDGSMGKRKFV